MDLLNERVEHTLYGTGVIVNVKEDSIQVRFLDPIGEKKFLFPDAFDKFLKADNADIENNIIEILREKDERIKLERKTKRKEFEEQVKAEKLERKKERLEYARQKSSRKKIK